MLFRGTIIIGIGFAVMEKDWATKYNSKYNKKKWDFIPKEQSRVLMNRELLRM